MFYILNKKLIFFVVLLLSARQAVVAQVPQQTPFVDITEAAGIDHQFAVHEGMFGGGICVFDLNKDGFEDLFITGGLNDDRLYLNQGNGTFRNVYEGSGLEVSKRFVTQGAVGADVNRDGWVDLFVTTITSKDTFPEIPRARNLLFLNNGNGTFRDATEAYGLAPLYSFSTGANFGDFNADGWPDLYVGNYFVSHEGKLSVISDATIVGANQTAKGDMIQTVHSGIKSNWTQAALNSIYSPTTVDHLQSYAFKDGSSYGVVVFNLSLKDSKRVRLAFPSLPNGSAKEYRMQSPSIHDDNETSEVVKITSATVSRLKQYHYATLNPCSIYVLTWSAAS